MTGCARRSQDTAAGTQIGAGQTWVYVESDWWMQLGDVNAAHGLPPHIPGPDAMAQGSTFVAVDGVPVCRAGHVAGCGHPTSGSNTVFMEQ